MKVITYQLILFLFFISCSSSQEHQQKTEEKIVEAETDSTELEKENMVEEIDTTIIDSVALGLIFESRNNYVETVNNISNLRNKLADQYAQISDSVAQNRFLDSVSVNFTERLLNDIVPYWYGTVWAFEGHTAKPNDGEIACGYFVSTTLRDMGLQLNRYDLAKKAGAHEAQSIAIDQNNLSIYKNIDYTNQPSFLEDLSEGLYFVGLDNHVGYIYKKGLQTYFLHSNYVDGHVMIEYTQTSSAFLSGVYYVTKITHNTALMKSWLQQQQMFIYE